MKFNFEHSLFKFKFLIIGLLIESVLYIIQLNSLSNNKIEVIIDETPLIENIKFGYNFNNFNVAYKTIKQGETFGEILNENNLNYPKIFYIAKETDKVFDTRQFKAGKPYILLHSKDGTNIPLVFIYLIDKINYLIVEFCDSINVSKDKKEVKIVENEASGIITSSMSETMESLNLPNNLIYGMTDDIYAWTIDFTRVQPGDNFKVIYKERIIVEDSTHAGIHSIDAAYFQHRGKDIYAFNYLLPNSINNSEYYDNNGHSLRKAFLKSPLKFSRITSRYNLKRRIKLYGYKVRPHKGTDFAAPFGTPIMATASGTVTKSEKRGGNGNYVKIRHNSTYSTQYLHMSKRLVNVGDYVNQGDVIGKIGMTGNTSGPHVCYRFWKNGKQVDPFKQKLPNAKSLSESDLKLYNEYIIPLKNRLDSIN